MKNLLFFAGIFLSLSFSNSENKEKIYLCTCQEDVDLSKADVESRKSFIYLVTTAKEVNCCTDKVLTKYGGFEETWVKGDKKGRTRALREDGKRAITATAAHKKGCSIENKVVSAIDASKFKSEILYYYPDFKR